MEKLHYFHSLTFVKKSFLGRKLIYTHKKLKRNKTGLNFISRFRLEWPPGDPRNKAVHEIIKKSFSLWSEVSPIVFRKNPYFWAADIKIKFAR